VYHLCVRPPVPRERMEREAATQWCAQSVARHFLFSPGFWRNLVLIQCDLIDANILPLSVGLRRLADLWIFNRLEPRELGLLPETDAVEERRSGARRRWLFGAWSRGRGGAGGRLQEEPLRTATV
jgi:hypothetical protein